jgi:hypothetical protein
MLLATASTSSDGEPGKAADGLGVEEEAGRDAGAQQDRIVGQEAAEQFQAVVLADWSPVVPGAGWGSIRGMWPPAPRRSSSTHRCSRRPGVPSLGHLGEALVKVGEHLGPGVIMLLG